MWILPHYDVSYVYIKGMHPTGGSQRIKYKFFTVSILSVGKELVKLSNGTSWFCGHTHTYVRAHTHTHAQQHCKHTHTHTLLVSGHSRLWPCHWVCVYSASYKIYIIIYIGKLVCVRSWQLLLISLVTDMIDSEAMCWCQCGNPKQCRNSMNKHACRIAKQFRYTVSIHKIYTIRKVKKLSTSCVFDSSHCPDNCTPCCSANCCARSPFPVSFTACTTVFQVRGNLPVPSLWHNQLSTSCNIHAPTFDPSSLILSIMAGSTCRNVPNSLHWASSWWFRALITSTWQIDSCHCITTRWVLFLFNYTKSEKLVWLLYTFSRSAAIYKSFISQIYRCGWQQICGL